MWYTSYLKEKNPSLFFDNSIAKDRSEILGIEAHDSFDDDEGSIRDRPEAVPAGPSVHRRLRTIIRSYIIFSSSDRSQGEFFNLRRQGIVLRKSLLIYSSKTGGRGSEAAAPNEANFALKDEKGSEVRSNPLRAPMSGGKGTKKRSDHRLLMRLNRIKSGENGFAKDEKVSPKPRALAGSPAPNEANLET